MEFGIIMAAHQILRARVKKTSTEAIRSARLLLMIVTIVSRNVKVPVTTMIGAKMKRSRHHSNTNKHKYQSQSNLQPSQICCKSFKPNFLKKLHTNLSSFHNLPFICSISLERQPPTSLLHTSCISTQSRLQSFQFHHDDYSVTSFYHY